MIICWEPYGNIKTKTKKKKQKGERGVQGILEPCLWGKVLHSYYIKKTLDMLRDAFPLNEIRLLPH